MMRWGLALVAVSVVGLIVALPAGAGGAPKVKFTSTPPAFSNDVNAEFTYMSPNAPGAVMTCTLDGSDQGCKDDSAELVGLAEGPHVFAVTGHDAGRAGKPAVYKWVVDTSPPPAPAFKKTPPPAPQTGKVQFSYTGEKKATFECYLDPTAWGFGPCKSSQKYSGLMDMTYTFHVRAVDQAGNEGAEATYTFTVGGCMRAGRRC